MFIIQIRIKIMIIFIVKCLYTVNNTVSTLARNCTMGDIFIIIIYQSEIIIIKNKIIVDKKK